MGYYQNLAAQAYIAKENTHPEKFALPLRKNQRHASYPSFRF
jgi:hypothetical protein